MVKHRLDKAGLGDFCLELHSHKTQKQRLLEDLKNRLDRQGKYPNPSDIDADIARFEDLKTKLNHYVEEINRYWKNTGLSIHQIFNSATRFREALSLNQDQYFIENINGDSLTVVRRRELLDLGEMLKSIYRQIQEQASGGDIANHYWFGVNKTELLGHQQEELAKFLEIWTQKLNDVCRECQSLSDGFDIPAELLAEVEQLNNIATIGCALPDLLGGEPLELLPKVRARTQELNQLLEQYESLYDVLEELEALLTPKAINADKAPTAIRQAVSQLKAFGLLESESIASIQADFDEIKAADGKARSLAGQLQLIREKVPENLQELTLGNAESLAELKTFIDLVAQLPVDLWRHRDEVFDAPEMDDLLSSLTGRFNDLVPVHKKLQEHFKLEALPPSNSVKELKEILCDAGFFGFLDKRWWVARRVCLNLAVRVKPNKKQLFALLPQLVSYKQELERIDQLNKENQSLADLYQGMDTPLERIVRLRDWYRTVRNTYGRGLGPKAKFAEALFSLDRHLAMSLSDLSKDGFLEVVSQVLDSLGKARHRYSNNQAINNQSSSLLSDKSPFSCLQKALQKLLNFLTLCFAEDMTTLAECMDVARKLQNYQEKVPQWKQNELIQLLAPTNLPLDIAPGKRNAKALSVAHNFSAITRACEDSDGVYTVISQDCGVEKYNTFREAAGKLQMLLAYAHTAWNEFEQLGKVNADEWQRSSGSKLDQLIQRNHNALSNKAWLNNWLEYIRLRKKLTNEGMQKLLRAVEQGELNADSLIDVMNMVLMHQLSTEILEENPYLAEFSGMEQMAIRERFCEYDKKLLTLQRLKIAYRAAQAQPPIGNASGKVGTYTNVSLIQHEAAKKRGHIAVRALIDRAGRAIQALKPCFMMSPMSVAQYIKPGMFEFDIVMMDEASQIRPEDALGSIARGNSLVVVGDPKQLPPTSFFDKMTNDDQDEDSVALEESESILETAMPMFRTRRLRWHYRSRHESLIAFSNLHYYNSDLVIFPSPHASGSQFGIRYHKVQRGRFTRGKNSEEARVIANAALKHMLECSSESVGLVAMNAEQRTEIEMHVEQLVKENSEFKAAYDKNQISDEPFFVKNLENVQGDERDVIMISMTYGPDEVGGKVYQRFGPITYDVGWRRLNVLFTRSKKRMQIFSSMDSHQIQVTGKTKKGVQSLRRFLEYCENGHLMSAEISGRAPDSDFEIAVKDALSQKGYECEPQLGVAGYYLDLAVKDPDYPGTYLLGVECDGATYHSAKSARDRDRLRQEILESLGWKIHRIWSTDWFKNPQAQLQPILNYLEKMTEGRVAPVPAEADASVDIVMPSLTVQEFEEGFDENIPSGDKSLRDLLIEFDKETIRERFSDTNPQKRLLRPAMLEMLVNEVPTSKEEFAFKIPEYLRSATEVAEAREFLGEVLEIIGEYG